MVCFLILLSKGLVSRLGGKQIELVVDWAVNRLTDWLNG